MNKIILKGSLLAITLIMFQGISAVNPESLKKQMEEAKNKFPFFTQLPADIQTIIISETADAPNYYVARQRLAKLREVNKQFKSLIDDPHTGKQIREMIAAKYPESKKLAEEIYMILNQMASSGEMASSQVQTQIQELLKQGADPNATSPNLLIAAVMAAPKDSLNWTPTMILLEHGVNINTIENGKTALDVAEENNNPGLVKFLREKGAKKAGEL